MDKKEFKVGQIWMQRDGQNVKIVEIDETLTYAVRGANNERWTLEGDFLNGVQGEPQDLIELVQDVVEPVPHARTNIPSKAPCWGQSSTCISVAPDEPLVATQASEPAIPDTEIARTIAQFIASQEISLRSWTEERDRLQREHTATVARCNALTHEIDQAKIALAALK